MTATAVAAVVAAATTAMLCYATTATTSSATDLQERGNIVDVCGEDTAMATLERPVGYIESMNYPSAYSPDTNCSCWLQVCNMYTDMLSFCQL